MLWKKLMVMYLNHLKTEIMEYIGRFKTEEERQEALRAYDNYKQDLYLSCTTDKELEDIEVMSFGLWIELEWFNESLKN